MPPPADRYLTPRQRIAAGAVTVCCGIAAVGIKLHEGYSNKVYPDVVLKWKAPTICTGHVDTNLVPGTVYTDDQCDQLLIEDVRRKTYDGILPCIGDVPMPDHELAAYLSLAFNIGPGAFCKSSIPAKLKVGDHPAACKTILLYRFVGGHDCGSPEWARQCGGIVKRRSAEYALCATGV